VAATVAQGVHGRRRVGVGDSFWQYRPFVTGDAASRIDWRRSALSDRVFVRDMEWEAAQTVCLWRDGSASMAWRSARGLPEKKARAELLMLALAALLFRAGEQVRVPGLPRVFAGRNGLAALASFWPEDDGALPAPRVPAHSRVVLAGDFLAPLEEIRACLAGFAALPVKLHVLQILDPAELSLPYEGRVRFLGLERDGEALIPRVASVRDAYAQALAAQMQGLRDLCAAAGFSLSVHRTDHAPETALMGLYVALDAGATAQAGARQAGARRAGTGQAGTGQAGTGQARTGQAGTGQAGTGQAGTGQAGTGQAGTGKAGAPP
jgi:uncharacterized protein (DUF58 family)